MRERRGEVQVDYMKTQHGILLHTIVCDVYGVVFLLLVCRDGV